MGKLEKQLKRKEQECEELKEDRERWKSNFNGKVSAIEELLHQLDQLKAENEELRRSITKIFACLIKANRTNKIVDTIWVNRITTLWDYIALTLGIEGDQTQIEEQIHINPLIAEEEPVNKYKQALNEIIRFFKEDEKFARYSGRPIIFAKPTLEKIEKILKENDIKIS